MLENVSKICCISGTSLIHCLRVIRSTPEAKSTVLCYTYLCVYHNLRGNFMVRLRGNSSTERGHGSRPATTHLASVHSHRRERKRYIYIYIYISIEEIINRRGHFTRIHICVYVYGSVARGRQDNYRFEIVYAGTLIEPRRLNNSRRCDSSSSFFSIVETARRGEGRERKKKTIVPFYPLSPRARMTVHETTCTRGG